MRVSGPLMGVKRIFPLIKQHAPECIIPIASLSALPPKCRIAIDATLLVQRLHFSPDQHPDRHALGFSRLIRQLREYDLIPIMVFDNFGQQARLPAKSREHSKRRTQRYMLAVRAKIELQRAKRLRSLQAVVEEYKILDVEDRVRVTRLLNGWRDEDHVGQSEAIRFANDEDHARELASTMEELALSSLYHHGTTDVDDFFELSEPVSSILDKELEEQPSSNIWDDVLSREREQSEMKAMSLQERKSHSWDESLWSQVLEIEQSVSIKVAARIRSLRRQYGLHLARTRAADTVAMELSSEWPKETATQIQMTQSEGDVYRLIEDGVVDSVDVTKTSEEAVNESQETTARAICEASREGDQTIRGREGETDNAIGAISDFSSEVPSDRSSAIVDNGMPEGSLADETVWLDLDTISERSSVMQRNYLRSSTSLSQAAFETCAALCETLGVPVLWTGSGVKGEGRPHEAEAMASMLVRHGYADIVASEDSDVILYDVPLLRGIMGNKTLEIVDSSMLRRRLFPPNVSDDRTTPGKSGQNIPGSADNHTGDEDDLTGTLTDFAQAECVQRAEEDSKRQMLDFALLCGTDFNRTLPGIAAGRALKLIQQYGSIDGIRRASVQLTQSNTSTPNSSDTDKARIPRKSSLLDTIAAGGALRPPDHLTWREYSKELTQARQVFENPPTLFWQLRKVRDLRRDVTDADCTESSTSLSVVQDLIDKSIKQRDIGLQVMTKGIGSAGRKKRTARVNAASSNLDSTGFGSTPFGDDKAIATWQ